MESYFIINKPISCTPRYSITISLASDRSMDNSSIGRKVECLSADSSNRESAEGFSYCFNSLNELKGSSTESGNG